MTDRKADIREKGFLCAVFLLYITRYAIFGFEYYPILDDHIQYYWYQSACGDIREVFFGIGTLNTRPLAGLFDVYLWGRLYSLPGAVLVVSACISFFAVYFLRRVLLLMNVRVGAAFYLILLFLPITVEAQYWLSASSRVMVGVFASSAAVLMFDAYKKRRTIWLLILFAALQLASMCFYEQAAIFSFLLCIAYFYRTKQCRDMYLIPIVNASLITVYYLALRNVGALSGRTKIILPSEIISHLVFILKELYNVIIQGIFSLTANGFVRALTLLWERPVFFAAIIFFSVALAYLYTPIRKNAAKTDRFSLWLGAALAALPLGLIFLISGASLPYRTVYIPLIGAAIAADYGLQHIRLGGVGAKVLLFLSAFILSVSCVSEIYDYAQTSVVDRRICKNIIAALDDDVLSGTRECYVVGAKEVYVPANARHAEHILSVTSSDWALTGAVRRYAGGYVKRIVPIKELSDEILKSDAQILVLGGDYTITQIRQ